MMRIYAKDKRFTGKIGGVSFKDGVGETNDASLIEFLKARGYRVESMSAAPVPEPMPKPVPKPTTPSEK